MANFAASVSFPAEKKIASPSPIRVRPLSVSNTSLDILEAIGPLPLPSARIIYPFLRTFALGPRIHAIADRSAPILGRAMHEPPRHQQQFLQKLQIRYSQKDQKRRKFQWGYVSLVYLFRIST